MIRLEARAAETINETDPRLNVVPRNTKGSAENIGLLERGKADIALVAGEPVRGKPVRRG